MPRCRGRRENRWNQAQGRTERRRREEADDMPAVPSFAAPGTISARVVLRVVLVVLLVVLALWLIYLLRRPLTWIFIAGFLAIALSGPVNWLHRQTGRRGISIALVYLALILLPVLLAAILVPPIVEQLNNLINNLPQYVSDLQEVVQENDRLRQLEEDYNITAELQNQARTLPGRFGDAAGILSDIGLGLVNSVFAGVTILVLSLFMIGSGRGWLDWIADRQGPERAVWLKRLYDRIGVAVGNYVAGALGQALIAGVLAYILLLIQSRAVSVHPFVVLTSVLFGSTLFGVLGALLAIPVAAAIQISIVEYSRLRRPEDPPAPPVTADAE